MSDMDPNTPGPGREPDADSSIVTVKFLISNIHCSSCVSNIEDALFALSPRPCSVDTSVVSRTVTVRRHLSLHVSALSEALEKAGFEIFDVMEDPNSGILVPESSQGESNLIEEDGWIDRAVDRWTRSCKSTSAGERKRATHVIKCDICRAEEKEEPAEKAAYPPPLKQGESFREQVLPFAAHRAELMHASKPSG